MTCLPENLLNAGLLDARQAAAPFLRRHGRPFEHLALLPVVEAGAMFAEDETLSLADEVLMLRSKSDMAAAASAVLDGNDDAVFFVVQEPLINPQDLWIGRLCEEIAARFKLASFRVDHPDALFDLVFEVDAALFGLLERFLDFF
jgi:hypothetical protein